MSDTNLTKPESFRRTLDRMYSCRDLEISNLWQRSIFLGTFLVLCFTGYGVLLHSILILKDGDSEFFLLLHFVCCLLAILSAIFSVLWIQMAKGSKAWYEVYETYITKFQNEFKSNLDYESKWGMGNHNDIIMDDSLLSVKAGGYSPSKINIVIGQVSLIVWLLILISHMGLYAANILDYKYNKYILSGFLGIIVVGFIWFLICIFNTKRSERINRVKEIKQRYERIRNGEKKKKGKKAKKRFYILTSFFFNQVRSGFLHNE